MPLKPALLACLLLVLGATHARPVEAGAWMRSEGSGLVRASVATSSASSRWDNDRKLSSAPCTRHRQSLGVHAEYGYSYYRTLFASAELGSRQCSDDNTVSGVSDLTVGMRGRLDPFRNGRTWEAALKLPISGTTADPDRPGNGEFGLDLGVHFSLSPDPYDHVRTRGGVWSWGTGVRVWSGGLAHQAWGYGGWSRRLNEDWGFSTRLSGTLSFGGHEKHADGIRRNDYDKLTANASLRRNITRSLGVSVGLSQDIQGRNTDRATRLRLSVSHSWR